MFRKKLALTIFSSLKKLHCFWVIGIFGSIQLFANPTGLIDNLALGINRKENPDQLIAERDHAQEEPFLVLKQSGNIIFQVHASGNIEWSGSLNQNKSTTMGNLLPVTEGTQLGSTESTWGKLYLNEMYFPLLESEAKELSSEKVDLTLGQLEAVEATNKPNEIHLKLKSSKTVSVKNPKQKSFYNVSHIIPIIIKRLQDDRTKTQDKDQLFENLTNQSKALELQIEQLLKENKQHKLDLSTLQQSSNQKITALEQQIKGLQDQMNALTKSMTEKLNTIQNQPVPTAIPEEAPSP